MNSLLHYTQAWVNRRSREGFLSENEHKYSYYYRDSWNRFCERFEIEADTLFPMPPDVVPITTITIIPTEWTDDGVPQDASHLLRSPDPRIDPARADR